MQKPIIIKDIKSLNKTLQHLSRYFNMRKRYVINTIELHNIIRDIELEGNIVLRPIDVNSWQSIDQVFNDVYGYIKIVGEDR